MSTKGRRGQSILREEWRYTPLVRFVKGNFGLRSLCYLRALHWFAELSRAELISAGKGKCRVDCFSSLEALVYKVLFLFAIHNAILSSMP